MSTPDKRIFMAGVKPARVYECDGVEMVTTADVRKLMEGAYRRGMIDSRASTLAEVRTAMTVNLENLCSSK